MHARSWLVYQRFRHETCTTKFASYELVPNDIQQKLIAEHEAEVKEEEE